jgi:uncharacterized protein
MIEKVKSGTGEMDELFSSLSLCYISRSRQIVTLSSKLHYKKSSYYRKNRDEFDRLNYLYSAQVRDCLVIPSSVRQIDDSMGRGLFAEREIDQGEFIGEYTGLIQKASPCRPVKDSLGGYKTDYTWTYPERKGLFSLEVNGRLNGNETRFINHSFTPNCSMEHTLVDNRWVLFLVALRSIAPEDQLSVDYGEEYWVGGHRELILI